MTVQEQAMPHAKVIWDYHHMHHVLKKADVMIVLGSHDLLVPEYAVGLFLQDLSPLIAVTGGIGHVGDLLETGWNGKTEAEMFASVLIDRGIPSESVLREDRAMNTGENFEFVGRMFSERGIDFSSALVVTKPYMERRAFATGMKWWPKKELIVTSPNISFEDYCARSIPFDVIVNLMMGDLQRIEVYGKSGFQIFQEIPAGVWEAFDALKHLGFTRHLLAK